MDKAKKFIFSTIGTLGFVLVIGGAVFAQGMLAPHVAVGSSAETGFPNSSSNSAALQSQQQEEQEGRQFLDNLNNKTFTCLRLKDADFEKIGEYFMGQSIGDVSRHIAMNEMMKSMMGEQGEEQMHIAWGKRGSGCDTSAAFPSQGEGLLPMMQMMMGGPAAWSGVNWSSPFDSHQSNNAMMNFGFTPFGGFGWFLMILWWIVIIAGIVALIEWLTNQSRSGHDHEKSPLEILKERYAKGEIDRKEFEGKSREIKNL